MNFCLLTRWFGLFCRDGKLTFYRYPRNLTFGCLYERFTYAEQIRNLNLFARIGEKELEV